VSFTVLLVTFPEELLTVTYTDAPFCDVVVFAIVYVEEFVPAAAPLRYHWYVSGAVPFAATVNVAACPAVTVCAVGCVVIDGAVAAALTDNFAIVLVAVPFELLTVT